MTGITAQKNLQGRIAKEVQNADVKLLLNGVEQIITINTKLLEDLGKCFRPKASGGADGGADGGGSGSVQVSDDLCVGTIFARFAPLMAIYSDYARAETNALQVS